LRARVHRHGHVSLSQRGRVVRAIAGHGTNRPPLIFADQLSFASGVASARKSSTPLGSNRCGRRD
jgi:hypothetical protein